MTCISKSCYEEYRETYNVHLNVIEKVFEKPCLSQSRLLLSATLSF